MLLSNVADFEPIRPREDAPYRSAQVEPRQRLVFTRGASRVTLESMRDAAEVIDSDFDGADVRVSQTSREVRIGYHWSFLSYAYDVLLGGPVELPHSTIRLNENHVWDVQCQGGVSDLEAHLEHLALGSLAIHGGASTVHLALGRPTGIVPIRIRGGVSRLEIVRPTGVGVRLSVRGGISSLAFDAMELGSIGGGLSLSSRTGAEDVDRYEIEIGGGVSDLSIT